MAETQRSESCESVTVVVVIAYYRGQQFITRCLQSLSSADWCGLLFHIVVVDNEGVGGLENQLQAICRQCSVITPSSNLGFAEANNRGYSYARERFVQLKYIALLNQDTAVTPGWLQPLLDCLHVDQDMAAVQPTLVLMQDPTRLNSAGNEANYLGFGFVTKANERLATQSNSPREIGFASGAAVLLKASAVDQCGLFDGKLFMYCEDIDLGWTLRQAGYRIVVAPESVVHHHYEPKPFGASYYLLERNRLLLLLSHYSVRSLFLILPMLVVMEFGQWIYAARIGRLSDRLRLYRDLLQRQTWTHLRSRRKHIQERTVVSQQEFCRRHVAAIDNTVLNSLFLRWVGNPLLRLWWKLIFPLLSSRPRFHRTAAITTVNDADSDRVPKRSAGGTPATSR